MEERSYTTQTDLSLNHALVRLLSGGLYSIINFYTKTAAAGACIFCVAKKGNSDAALSPQSTPFSGLHKTRLDQATCPHCQKITLFTSAI